MCQFKSSWWGKMWEPPNTKYGTRWVVHSYFKQRCQPRQPKVATEQNPDDYENKCKANWKINLRFLTLLTAVLLLFLQNQHTVWASWPDSSGWLVENWEYPDWLDATWTVMAISLSLSLPPTLSPPIFLPLSLLPARKVLTALIFHPFDVIMLHYTHLKLSIHILWCDERPYTVVFLLPRPQVQWQLQKPLLVFSICSLTCTFNTWQETPKPVLEINDCSTLSWPHVKMGWYFHSYLPLVEPSILHEILQYFTRLGVYNHAMRTALIWAKW